MFIIESVPNSANVECILTVFKLFTPEMKINNFSYRVHVDFLQPGKLFTQNIRYSIDNRSDFFYRRSLVSYNYARDDGIRLF